jgi:hypothetical protein
MAGVSWHVTLLPVKVCDLTGTCPSAAIAAGINWAVTSGVQIINIGIGLSPTSASPAVDAAVANAISHGVLVVASAGNYAGYVAYPANLSGVIAVGATDSTDTVASFSGRGTQLSLVAPGAAVLSLARQGCCIAFTGSEFAAAHVSGALALLLAAGVPPSSAKTAVLQGAKDLGAAGVDTVYGYGRLDICNALVAAGIGCPVTATTATPMPPTATPAPPTPTSVPPTATATLTATPAPPTATQTSVPPTATSTPMPPTPTSTRTATAVPPTPTSTSVPPTATATSAPSTSTAVPTATRTSAPPTATATSVLSTPTAVPTVTPSSTTLIDTGKLQMPAPAAANKNLTLASGKALSTTVTWTGSATSRLQVYLFDSSGLLVATGSGSGKTRSFTYQALTTGSYTVQVHLESGKSASYTLSNTY